MKWDPVEAEFFAEEGAPDALVREAIQNSLDAAIEDVIRVRFAFGSTPDGNRYLKGLSAHLNAIDVVEEEDTVFDGALEYLAVEDFGTRGLTGDVLQVQDDDDEVEEKNNFYYFWRNIGRSKKEEGDIGRWGLGKRVFPSSSRISSFFGLTRRPEGDENLMGQSVLKTHYHQGNEYFPYGFYSHLTATRVSVPVDEQGWLSDFRKVFNLTRTDEAGLSIVIPKPKLNLTPEAIQRAVLKHYFYPLIEGRLQVEVTWDDGVVEIQGDNIDAVAERLSWTDEDTNAPALLRLFDFARRLPRGETNGLISLNPAGEDGAPSWSLDLLEEDVLTVIREGLHGGELISLRVPVFVHSKKHGAQESEFRLHMESSPDAKSRYGDLYFLRRGITIPAAGRWRRRDVRAMVVVESGPLSTLLGDAENPAHTDWIANAERVKREYERAYSTINFVKHSVAKLMDLLAQSETEVDRDWLQDVFSIPEESPQSGNGKPTRKRKKTLVPNPDPPTRPPLFEIAELRGGFAVRGTGKADPEAVTVRVAYDLSGGNPFKNWSEFDFTLDGDEIAVSTEDCEVTRVEGNKMWVNPLRPKFELKITGFDVRRDLRVDVRRAN